MGTTAIRLGACLATAALFVCGATSCAATPDREDERVASIESATSSAVPTRAMWVWAYKSSRKTELLAFAGAKKVDVLYVEDGTYGASATSMPSLVAAAALKGIAIELLLSEDDWALTKNHAAALAAITSAIDVASKPGATKPRAVHLDVEPHALAGWSTNKSTYASQYLDLLASAAALAHARGLELTVDIPTFYASTSVARGTVTRPLSQWVTDAVDRVVLMDYRDAAGGANGIVSLATPEMSYAASVGKRVVVGVETQCGLSDPSISFCEEGEAAMNGALATTTSAFSASRAWGGVAVHHFDSWETLRR